MTSNIEPPAQIDPPTERFKSIAERKGLVFSLPPLDALVSALCSITETNSTNPATLPSDTLFKIVFPTNNYTKVFPPLLPRYILLFSALLNPLSFLGTLLITAQSARQFYGVPRLPRG
jgi:hypothetical protein